MTKMSSKSVFNSCMNGGASVSLQNESILKETGLLVLINVFKQILGTF